MVSKKCSKSSTSVRFLRCLAGSSFFSLESLSLIHIYGNPYLGVIILVAMVANMMIAAFVGFVIPVVLKACHADPAVASSIFITTFTDVCGFFIFLGLAKISLPYLIR